MRKICFFISLCVHYISTDVLAMESLETLAAKQILTDIKAQRLGFDFSENCLISKTRQGRDRVVPLSEALHQKLSTCSLEPYMDQTDPLVKAVEDNDAFGFISICGLRKILRRPYDRSFLSSSQTLTESLRQPSYLSNLNLITNPLFLGDSNISLCYRAVVHGHKEVLEVLLNTIKKTMEIRNS